MRPGASPAGQDVSCQCCKCRELVWGPALGAEGADTCVPGVSTLRESLSPRSVTGKETEAQTQ